MGEADLPGLDNSGQNAFGSSGQRSQEFFSLHLSLSIGSHIP